MSRTRRRNKREIIVQHCGTIDELDDWDRARWPGRDDKQVYARRVHSFTNDTLRWTHAYPRWFRWIHWTKPIRTHSRHEIHRCLRNGSWDDHLSPRFGGGGRHGLYW